MLNATISELVFGKPGCTASDHLADSAKILEEFSATLKVGRARFRAQAMAMPTLPPRPLEDYDQGGAATATQEEFDDDPFVAARQQHERAERLFDVSAHEARHAIVGLHYGAQVAEVKATWECGHVRFRDIPKTRDIEVTIAGSLWESSGIWGRRASSDISFVDRAVLRENADARPGTDAWHTRIELAQSRCDEVLERECRAYRALRDHLVEYGDATAEEVADIWERLRYREREEW